MLLVLQIAQYEAVAPEGQKLLLVLVWEGYSMPIKASKKFTGGGGGWWLKSTIVSVPIPLWGLGGA